MGNRPFSDSTSALSFLCYAPSLKQAGPPAGITELGCTLPNTGSRSDFFSTKMIDAPHVSWQSNRLTGLSSRQCRTELGGMRLT